MALAIRWLDAPLGGLAALLLGLLAGLFAACW
jgi:hypothetical protein